MTQPSPASCRLWLTISFCVLGFAQQASANFVNTFSPTNPDRVISDINPTGGDSQRVADNFTLSQTYNNNANVLVLTWYGFTQPMQSQDVTLPFEIQFFYGSGSSPQTLPVSNMQYFRSVTGDYRFHAGSGTEYYEYTTVLDGGINLIAGSQYWISIAERRSLSGNGSRWQWAASNNSTGYAFRTNDGSAWTSINSYGGGGIAWSRAFSLRVANIPEPGSLCLTGMLSVLFLWRSNKKTVSQNKCCNQSKESCLESCCFH